MSSSEDQRSLQIRKNPGRTCRMISEVIAQLNRPSQEMKSTKGKSKATSEFHNSPGATPIMPLPERKPRGKVAKLVNHQCQTPTTTNGNLSSNANNSELVVPQQTTCVIKPQKKGICRKGNLPSKKRVCLNTRSAVCNEELSEQSTELDSPRAVDCDNSEDTKKRPQRKCKIKHSYAQRLNIMSDQAPVQTCNTIHTHSTLGTSPKLAASASHSYSALTSFPLKRSRRQTSPGCGSTPAASTYVHPSLPVITESGQCHAINSNKNELKIYPAKSSLSQKRGRPQKPQVPQKSVVQHKEQQELCTALTAQQLRKNAEAEPLQNSTSSVLIHRARPCFEFQDVASHEPEQALPSDLSIKVCVQEEEPYPLDLSLSMQEDEEEEEDEELPSFLQQSKPSLIKEKELVWCKLRKYPFWPAMVKRVNHKNKKASIVFIDGLLFDKKTFKKGFCVSLRTLKAFDCEDSEHFVDLAKEKYGDVITWCQELISDYRIRIGCGSFFGSFTEYFDDDISCPVRNKYPKVLSSELTFPSQELLSDQGMGDGAGELKLTGSKREELHSKKVLPDRTLAARNRANERLVDFIVKKRGVENRLLAVISGQELSKWRQALDSSSRSVVDVYLEDEEQVDKVYRYLESLCENSPELETTDHIRFILDVLLPEALIYAIAGVDHLSLDKAEAKYRRGPRHSNRERQEFDMMIEQQMKLKATGPSP